MRTSAYKGGALTQRVLTQIKKNRTQFSPTCEHITSSKILIIHFINSVTGKINCFICHGDRHGATIASSEFWSAIQAALKQVLSQHSRPPVRALQK